MDVVHNRKARFQESCSVSYILCYFFTFSGLLGLLGSDTLSFILLNHWQTCEFKTL